MKTRSLLFSMLILLGVIGFTSCQDDEVSPLTKQEAEQEISNTETQVATLNTEIINSEGFKVQAALSNIGLPDVYKKQASITDQNKELKAKLNYIKKGVSGDFDFDFEYLIDLDFEDYVGVWNWTANGWVKASTTTSNQIILNFPYPASNTTNNAKVTYSDYTTKLILNQKYPTGLKCKIEIGNQEVFSFAYAATVEGLLEYSSTLTVNFGKYSVISDEDIDFSSLSKYSMSGGFTLKKDGAIIYKKNMSMVGTPKGDTDMHYVITAKLRFLTLEFRMKIEADKSQMESINFDITKVLEMSLYTTEGAKVGDFKYVIENQQPKMYFVYADGTQVLANQVFVKLYYMFSGFLEDIEDESVGK